MSAYEVTAVSQRPAAGEWVPMASWGVRVVARLIDEALLVAGMIPYFLGLVVLIGALPHSSLSNSYAAASVGDPHADPATVIFASVMMLVGSVLCLGLFIWNRIVRQGRTGQSIGKSVMNLYLVSGNDGNPIGCGTSFVREILHVLDGILYLGYLWPLWDPKRQTFADKILNSVVAHPSRHPGAVVARSSLAVPEPDLPGQAV